MSIIDIINAQGNMFVLMFIGMFLFKCGMITDEGKRVLTDFMMYVTLPCMIVKSFFMELDGELFKNAMLCILITTLMEFGCLILSRYAYFFASEKRKNIMKYGSICSNSGILGNPVAESLFNTEGVMYASMSLIPIRVFMWTFGLMYFTSAPSKKVLLKKMATHPCMIGCFAGLFFMFTGLRPPVIISNTIASLSSANTAISCVTVGTILAGVNLKSLLDPELLYMAAMRLMVLPGLTFGICTLCGITGMVRGIPVIFASMPCAMTTAVMAVKYHYDENFATSLVVMTTLFSIITIPVWCYLLL